MQNGDMLKLKPINICWRTGYIVIDYRDRIAVAGLTIVDNNCAAAYLMIEVEVLSLF
ncbi:hypothetical protein FocTR4_00001547 [Fusarium oxysporum f. sp. cubense]|uniref:Uncharacterized protein n=1 Tax=Fusarium oxysporum f. sp. cubense TaxID=61366 RepID=A0A5C6T2V0_FUSOC|nr:hypothetical protein FocTR4_00001547 [Fusarium oxysporum f. sp. cubense]